MKAGQRYILFIILLLISNGLVFAQTSAPQITRLVVQSDGVLINWTFDEDNSVDHYEIYRSTDINGTFSDIGNTPKGTLYFVDKTDLFKTVDKLFYYKVKAVGAGYSLTSSSRSIIYSSTSSAAKRTWGSIKAMFR